MLLAQICMRFFEHELVAREHPETRQRELVGLKWGLVPHWAADAKIGYKMINARSETAASKPSLPSSG